MKHLFILLLVVGFYHAEAQKADSLWYYGRFIPSEIIELPAGYTIVSFGFEIINKGDVFIEKNKGPELNAKCRDMLNRTPPESKICIDDVIVEKDGKKMKWKGKTLTVR